MEFKDLINGLLTTAYKLSETEVASLYNEDGTVKDSALEDLLKKDKTRISEVRTNAFDDGVKKTQREDRSAFEGDIKKKYGIDSSKIGIDLIDEIITIKTPKPGAITEEQIIAHPKYLDLKDNLDKKVKEAVTVKEQEFNTYKASVERTKTLSTVKQKAESIFQSLNPILSSDPVKASNQKSLFLEQLEKKSFRIDGDKIILTEGDNKDALDEHNNRIDFDSFVKDTASKFYDFQAGDPKGSSGNRGSGGGEQGGAGGTKIVAPKNEDEFKQMMNNPDAKVRAEVGRLWSEAQKQKS